MKPIQFIPAFFLKNGGLMSDKGAVESAVYYNNISDALLLWDMSDNDEEHDANISTIKRIVEVVDISLIIGGNIKRLEDVKKYLYAGASMVYMNCRENSLSLIQEAMERFGKDKIAIYANQDTTKEALEQAISLQPAAVISEHFPFLISGEVPRISLNECDSLSDMITLAKKEKSLVGISSSIERDLYACDSSEILAYKQAFIKEGLPVVTVSCQAAFSDMKVNNDGLIPVIVQDYKTAEVLMLAYMNEEAFEHTIQTGRMTYYSRSRQELWEKGLTSGHFQYVKSLDLDCDKDTLLAKVFQVGAACHTGKYSCFFNNIYKKEYNDSNPMKVFEEVFQVILDRKEHPKEGSYTNYLFDKGIDKILKKVGEEATEIVIAAKNPDPDEIKYEISDFLYHVMVLMAERGVTWDEIVRELARR